MRFDRMWSKLDTKRKDRFFARDFMWYDAETKGTIWWYAIEDWVTETDTEGYEIIDYEGGIYAAAISKDGDHEDGTRVHNGIYDWIVNSGCFDPDDRPGHHTMFHIAGTPESKKVLGYAQLEIFRPIKQRSK